MKRLGKIYPKIFELDNLFEAHRHARKDKLFYKEVKMVDDNPFHYLLQIQHLLETKTYRVSDYTISIIHDKGKDRELMKLPYFPDRIIQWAILLQIEHVFMNTFCTHTCASIKNRGIHRASKLTTKYIRSDNGKYCLKFDVKKFYPSINHEILKCLLRRKFKDNDLLELIDQIIDSVPDDKGVPIGSYLSQFLANFYLAYFDHWLKEEKKVKCVIRYMDDIVIFGDNKEELHKLLDEIRTYLWNSLRLQVKENYQVYPSDIRGVDFVGFRHFRDFKLLRKRTCKRLKKCFLKIKRMMTKGKMVTFHLWCAANSYWGWMQWCDSYRLKSKYHKPIEPILKEYHSKFILKLDKKCKTNKK